MVPLRSVFPCGTYLKLHLVALDAQCELDELPYIKTLPLWGLSSPSISLTRVLFPMPVAPATTVIVPGRKLWLKELKSTPEWESG